MMATPSRLISTNPILLIVFLLQLYDQQKDQVFSFPRPNTDVPHIIYALHIDKQQDSILWIGGINGLSAFDTYHQKYIPNQQFPTDLLTIDEDLTVCCDGCLTATT